MQRILHLCQNFGKYGHGGADPPGIVNMVGTPDVFMVVSIVGAGAEKHVVKVPPLCLHVVQWLYTMKVSWTTVGFDGEMIDGLAPVYDFLHDHTLCHRFQPSNVAISNFAVSGIEANHFGSGQSRMIEGQMRSNEVKFNSTATQKERLSHMGVGDFARSPPPKIAKTITVSSVLKPIAVVLKTDSTGQNDKLDNSIKEPDSGFQESDSMEPCETKRTVSKVDIKSASGPVHYRESILAVNVDNRCPCMDSLGSLPLGCTCGPDSLDIETPADSEIFESKDHEVPDARQNLADVTAQVVLPIGEHQKEKPQKESPVLVAADDQNQESDQPRMEVFFPRVLPPNPPNRRIPPLFRWAVHINHRPNDPALPTTVERRMVFMESIGDVPYNPDAQGREYRERQDFEWKKLLG